MRWTKIDKFKKGILPQGSLTAAECFGEQIFSKDLGHAVCLIWFCDNYVLDHMWRCIRMLLWHFPTMQSYKHLKSNPVRLTLPASEMQRFLDEKCFVCLFLISNEDQSAQEPVFSDTTSSSSVTSPREPDCSDPESRPPHPFHFW